MCWQCSSFICPGMARKIMRFGTTADTSEKNPGSDRPAHIKLNHFMKSILYISQYHPVPSTPQKPILMLDGKEVLYGDFFSVDGVLIKLLHKYCTINGFALKVCGRTRDPGDGEAEYFKNLLGLDGWEFKSATGRTNAYKHVTEADYVVFIDSTLGIESLARGKKAAAFYVRGKMLGLSARDFAWPAKYPGEGPFWTNVLTEQEFERVMGFITTVSDEEWQRVCQRFVPEIMEYDPGNTIFLKLMRKLGVPLRAEYSR